MDVSTPPDSVEVNPRKMSGTPVFRGTRIPVATLFDYWEAGRSAEDFIAEYGIENHSDTIYQFVQSLGETYRSRIRQPRHRTSSSTNRL